MFKTNIEKKTISNKAYRRVLHTTKQMQLVVMNIPTNQDIHMEKHSDTTQFIRVEEGKATAIVNGKKVNLSVNDSIIIPADTLHQIINTGKTSLKIYTLYSKPQHRPDLIQKTRPSDTNED